jgi:hypothetical protein
LHPIPKRYLRGTVVNFSEGSLALDPVNINLTLRRILKDAASTLSSNRWRNIYLIPTGHPLLSVAAALLVFRITRIDPVVVAYFGEEGYQDVKLDLRNFIFGGEATTTDQ